jgi:hypothetical protein
MLLKKSVSAAAMVAIVALLGSVPSVALAHQSSACLRWDDSEPMRCFNCMQKIWDGRTYHWHNTCPRRYFVPSFFN